MLDAVLYEERLTMAQPSTHHHPATRHKPKPHVAPAYVQQFIDTHLAAAQEIQRKYQVPAGVVIAQSALESNWGRSVVGNAYFGVKGRAPSGDSTTFTTHEVINGKAIKIDDAFRAYGSYEDAADDHAQMLRNNPRFRRVVSLHPQFTVRQRARQQWLCDGSVLRSQTQRNHPCAQARSI
ncbi:glycoside hydrolase family 73 protein [Paraburkholderia aspalathi]|jgi:flagellar protein FlgJ|uniref:glycoside hydrolase family 73 protein n=1 Tax=Paraburkholderia aspalathi TaxID=1324617 RepID=UPI00190AE1A3|nr:glucosaminidase domain-containing protein [Paraburkholderia aspalathi]MBK3843809.1 hypothetical protein [Paraburkholderia aspalathi]